MIETKDILIEALSEALEKMAFLSLLPMDDEAVKPVEMISTEIRFEGPQKGILQILAGSDFGTVLAENIGAVCEVNDEICCDALKEFVNVTCGLLLPLLANSSQGVFDVTVPKTIKGQDAPNWQEFITDTNTYVHNVEGQLIATRLTFE
jgi:CheY-specific phosphatase CheX